jgi:transposase-like protein
MDKAPATLQEAIQYFANLDNCISYLVVHRHEWKDGVVCPTCGSTAVAYMPSRRVWQCKGRHPKCQFSVKVGTIMEDSAITLDKWLMAMWMLANCKNGVSSWEIHRAIGVTQKNAWHMLHRIRLAQQDPNTGGKLSGEVEVDETFVGGKARNMHKDVKARRIQGRTGVEGKAIVAAVLERGGQIRAKVIDKRCKPQLQALVRENVEPNSALYSDALKSYDGLSEDYAHQVVDHALEYVNGNVHTNHMENFWSLLKRGINGTYVSVEPFHLFRYVDEQAFRYNNRKDTDGQPLTDAARFDALVGNIVGKRLTWKELTGKVGEKPATN